MFEPLRLKMSHTNLVREGKQHLLDAADENCKHFCLLPDLAFPPHQNDAALVCKNAGV
jgi:hypothetical protein